MLRARVISASMPKELGRKRICVLSRRGLAVSSSSTLNSESAQGQGL